MTIEDTYLPSLVETATDRLVIISGCSGGGKSTLLAELERRGHDVYEEAGRQVVREQLYIGGDGLPWADVGKFVELTVSRSMHNMISAARTGRLAFFDRGIVDQMAGSEHAGLPVPNHLRMAACRFRCNRLVFLTPPWPEIFRNDEERRHSFEEAEANYAPLCAAYEALGYRIVELPRSAAAERANYLLECLESTEQQEFSGDYNHQKYQHR